MPQHKAYVQQEPNGPLTLQTVDTPTPSVGQVLVTVLATPLLSYTKGVLSGQLFPLVHPLTPGIAVIGRIAAAGPDATNLSENQLEFCNPTITARDDPYGGTSILQGWFGGLSERARKLMEGTWRHGSWAEKMIVPTENVVPLDEGRLLGDLGYTIPQLCWINEFMVPFGGFHAAQFHPGSTVIVAPASGHFGGCAVRIALALGAGTVVAAARNEKSLSKVKELDAKGRVKAVVLSGDVERDSTALRNSTPDNRGADLYIDFSPPQAANATHPQACVAALRHGGQAVLMGGVREDLHLNYAQIMLNNIVIRGNFMYPLEAPYQMLGLVESGLLDLKVLNTATFPMEDIQKGIDFSEKHSGMADLTVLTVST